MDEAVLQEVFEELLESLEDVETQSAAILQIMKAKGIASEEELAPYFAQASKGSSVRLVATRARINHLLSAATRPTENSDDNQSCETPSEQPTESAESNGSPGNSKETPQGTSARKQSANDQKIVGKDSAPGAEAKGLSKENDSQTQGKPKIQPEAA